MAADNAEAAAPALMESQTLGKPGMASAPVSSGSSAVAPPPDAPTPNKAGFLTSLRDDIDPEHSDAPVLACCFVSGLCDSVAFNASNVFVSMQTGKPPPLGLSLSLFLPLSRTWPTFALSPR